MANDAAKRRRKLTIEVSQSTYDWLDVIAAHAWALNHGSPRKATPEDLLLHLAASAADGARRSGSWERGWLQQCTGWDGEGAVADRESPWSLKPTRVFRPRRPRPGARAYRRSGFPTQGTYAQRGRREWEWTE